MKKEEKSEWSKAVEGTLNEEERRKLMAEAKDKLAEESRRFEEKVEILDAEEEDKYKKAA